MCLTKKWKQGFVTLAAIFPLSFQWSFAEEKTRLTLESCMNLAEKHSYERRNADETIAQTEATKNQYFRSMFPTLNANLTFQNYNKDVNKAIGNATAAAYGVPGANAFTGNLTVAQPLVGLAKLLFTVRAYSENVLATVQRKDQTTVEARLSGANLFINAQKAKRLLNVTKSSLEVAQKQLKDASAQFDAGRLTDADVLKIRLNLENTNTQLLQAQTTYRISVLSLAEAIGTQNVDDLDIPADTKSYWEAKKSKAEPIETVLSQALTNRHDVLSADYTIKAFNMSKYASYASYLPDVNLALVYSRNFEANDIAINGTVLFPKKDIQDNFVIGLQLNWTLIDFGVRQAQINGILSQKESALIQKEQLQSKVRIDVSSSYYNFQDSIQVLDSARVSDQYAKDVYSQVRAQFLSGQATSTDLVSASSGLASAEANLANAIGDLDIAWFTLQKNTGSPLTRLEM